MAGVESQTKDSGALLQQRWLQNEKELPGSRGAVGVGRACKQWLISDFHEISASLRLWFSIK
jgi:hypothetical protein